MKTVDQAVKNWSAGMQQAGPRITAGVQAVTVAPGQKAADAQDRWQQAVSSARAKQRFASRSAAVPLGTWQSLMVQKGIARVAAGAQAAIPKFQAHMASFLPYVQGIAAQVAQMPKGGLENGIARMTAQVRGNAAYPGRQ